MDELGMDLNTYVIAEEGLPEDETRVLFRQLASAVSHCHKNRIVLRDMKLGKIFFADPQCTSLVFADLDGAEVMTAGPQGQLRDQVGSPAYVCPEVLCCKPYDGCAADMWSLGVVLFRMMTGEYPFLDAEPARLFDKILLGSSAIKFPASMSRAACDLVKRLLDRNPRARPTAASLLEEPWLHHTLPGVAMLRRRGSLASLSGDSPDGDAAVGSAAVVAASAASPASRGLPPLLLRRRGSVGSVQSPFEVEDDSEEQLVPESEHDKLERMDPPSTPTRGTFELESPTPEASKKRGSESDDSPLEVMPSTSSTLSTTKRRIRRRSSSWQKSPNPSSSNHLTKAPPSIPLIDLMRHQHQQEQRVQQLEQYELEDQLKQAITNAEVCRRPSMSA
jgi:serine/threonine protein kinase